PDLSIPDSSRSWNVSDLLELLEDGEKSSWNSSWKISPDQSSDHSDHSFGREAAGHHSEDSTHSEYFYYDPISQQCIPIDRATLNNPCHFDQENYQQNANWTVPISSPNISR
ncbi:MAG: hypothetical protein K2W97_07305, partial [Chthoniobacterales bacterium]|nr:hypothetical protein [Chthoniobacterales bacterium]